MNCKNSHVVTIKKVVNGGYGLASKPDGQAVLVRHALPGETVSIVVTRQQSQVAFARIVARHTTHPGRVEAPCRYYADCGGCDLQHTDYPSQCMIKQAITSDLLSRCRRDQISSHGAVSYPIMPAPHPFGYRQRIRLQVDPRGFVGFHRHQSHDVVAVTTCLLAHPEINRVLAHCRETDSFAKLVAVSESIEIMLDPVNETISLLALLNRPPRPSDRAAAGRICCDIPKLTRVFLAGRKFSMEGPFTATPAAADRLLTVELSGTPPLLMSWEAGGFSQVNLEQNRTLVELVVHLAAPTNGDRILDLFCGMGNFSLPLARTAGHVLGIESQGSAIRSARMNCRRNNLDNARFEQSDVVGACDTLINAGHRFGILICDPPRHGIPGLAPHLSRLCTNRLIYVSCDPATLCRDLDELVDAGFSLITIRTVDMFPQTHHIETVVLLEKN